MVSLAGLVTALTAAAASVTALPTREAGAGILGPRGNLIQARQSPLPIGPQPSTGTHDGYFYQWWNDAWSSNTPHLDVELHLNPGGGLSAVWNQDMTFYFGKGWGEGQSNRREFEYTAHLNVTSGLAFVGVYGWTRDPMIEYFIVEDTNVEFGDWMPLITEVTTSFGVYQMYREHIIRPGLGQPIIHKYYAVRKTKRSGGTINTGEIFDAWSAVGMNLSQHSFMILSVEGWYISRGSAELEILGGPA
ncbi:glycoside hydrolase family 11 protein [Sodiomyces alcalophilus JCM 7366]|uniref:glycoside hydrolase family 11 protein n=1 Tax=Sodiomyces alcalophilus JCM 7366 TaxID=591952 RepID=UPI0039B5CCEF